MRSRLIGAATTAAISSLVIGVNLVASPLASAATATSPAVAAQAHARAMPAGIAPGTGHYVAVCPPATPGNEECLAMKRTDIPAQHFAVDPAVTPQGYGPANIQSAYNLPSSAGSGSTVAIVDAYDDPTAESDLAVYRAQYGLPACTTANGCFKKVSQTGTTTYPAKNISWAVEISLDMDAVSASCPHCHIILVEANNSNNGLYVAENEAASLHPTAISNSWTGQEVSGDISDDAKYFNHPGIAITVSSGDTGYGTGYPATSPYVTAVGGTSLTTSTNSRGWAETVWNNALGAGGSGCSKYEPKPSWQKDTGCAKRTVADVSMDADPDTGLAIYDTTGDAGWDIYGGTSLSAPLVAGVYGLADSISATGPAAASYAYAHPSALNDVTSGNNGSCSGSYLCTAEVGYDGPTGLGTPNGLAAFSSAGSTSGNDFSVALSPASSSVLAGGSATSTVKTAVTSGSAQTVALSESGAPTGVTVSLSPASVTAGAMSTLTITSKSSVAAGTYPITVTGKATSGSHTATYELTVTTSSSGPVSYEAESSANTLAGGAKVIACAPCSGGARVESIGAGSGTLTFNKVTVPTAGTYQVVIAGTQDQGRTLTAYISVNGGTTTKTLFNRTASWTTVEDVTVPMTLKAGSNTIEISNPSRNAPDIDAIKVP